MFKNIKTLARGAIVLACGMLSSSVVYGADYVASSPVEQIQPGSGQPTWTLQITPYMWATGIKGDISPFRHAPTISVEKTFSDVLDDLDFGGFINIWARYDRFVLSGDLMYVSTTDSRAFGHLPALPIPLPPDTVVKGSVDSKQFMATLQGGYRIYDTDQLMVDALGGVRFWHISNDVTVSALGMSRSYGESFAWADPVIGARVFLPMTEKISLQAQADIGGFGVGSKLTWSALATLNYVVSKNLSFSAGYKVLDVNYDHGGHVFKTQMSGPVLGATWRF